MANKQAKKTKGYDLKAADRRRSTLIRLGLTVLVIAFAAGLIFWIVVNKKPTDARAISVSVSEKLVKDQSGKPKAVLTMYEDFLCPHCRDFESQFGPTVTQLIDSGAVQADYYMVAILDRGHDDYSSRSSSAAYCVADADTTPAKERFRKFHELLFAQQPAETATTFPTNSDLIETARIAGISSSDLSDCINSERYTKMAKGIAEARGVTSTPTIKINGEDFAPTTPADLITKITQITGPVAGLAPPAASSAAPTPAPAAPAAAPAVP